MPQPTVWLDQFQANTGTAETGTQDQPKIIGLSNGNFLIAWEELSEGVGGSAGTDIVGKIYDAEGNVVRDSFQINALRAIDDEGDFDIAATNDGGFVLVHVDDDISSPNQTEIIWEMFNSNGNFVTGNSVAIENVAADFLANPQVAVDLSDNSFIITFTDDVGADTDLRAVYVDSSGVAGAEFDIAQNGADFNRNGDVAILTNGNFASVYEEDDSGTTSVEVFIATSAGAQIALVAGSNGANDATNPQVAALANGNFVVVWEEQNDVVARIYNNTGGTVVSQFNITSTPGSENEIGITALPDGGFVVHWDDESFGQRAQAFLADGTPDGSVIDVVSGNTADSAVGVTADGRILFAWQENGEMQAAIYDGRSSSIDASDYRPGLVNFVNNTGPVFTRTGDTTLRGTDSDDTLLQGLGGNDLIQGDFNADTIVGGDGNDSLYAMTQADPDGSGVADMIFGDAGDDYARGSGGADTISGGSGDDTIEGGNGNDSLTGEAGRDSILGGDNDDFLHGFGSHDSLFGGNGNDDVRGGFGRDLLNGSGGNDTLRGFEGDDRLFGGGGSDTLVGNDGNDSLTGGGGSDRLRGDAGADTLNGRFGDDLVSGGGGDDLFEFRQGHGNDTYDDFVAGGVSGLDEIELIGFGAAFDTFAEVIAAASDNGNHTTIDFGGGDSILLLNVVVADLHQSDFVFS